MHENRVKPKVLVVDDERVIADTLAMILNQSGFDARAVYSGEKAVDMASTFTRTCSSPTFIMADLNGIDAAIMIRSILPRSKSSSFPDKLQQPICWKRRGRRATSSKSG